MSASVSRGSFIFFCWNDFSRPREVVALKTAFPFWFILYCEEILYLLNISMLYNICSVVHKTFLFFYTRRACLRGLKLREDTFLALVPEQTQIFHIVVTRVEGIRHPQFKLNRVFSLSRSFFSYFVQEMTKNRQTDVFKLLFRSRVLVCVFMSYPCMSVIIISNFVC